MTPLYGLLLAGGRSARMQRDKALLRYQGRSQLDRAFELLQRHAHPSYVSVKGDQAADETRAARPMIIDSFPGDGPIAGIRSALAAHPQSAWLVIACDLPFLTDSVLQRLVSERDEHSIATAFRSTHDGLPEPLCAIWEPAAAPLLAEEQAAGGRCPRKFLMHHAVRMLEPLDARALDNINTPLEYADASNMLNAASALPVTLHYYAMLREQAGRSEEQLQTCAGTPAELYAELAARYGFTLSREQLKVAVNNEFSEWGRPLAAGDAVVFIPPVAGG